MSNQRKPSEKFLQRLAAVDKPASPIRRYKESDAWLWTEVAAVVIGLAFIIPTAIALWIDLEDRKTQRIAQAWELVTRPAPGNSGKVPALEYLNSQGLSLVGIDLSTESNGGQSYLGHVDLSHADLYESDLSGATPFRADFSGSILGRANLSKADLRIADLKETSLVDANLSGADLSGANLYMANFRNANLEYADFELANFQGARFDGANLPGAKLSFVTSLNQEQLYTVCGSEETLLPDGFTINDCPTN